MSYFRDYLQQAWPVLVGALATLGGAVILAAALV